MDGSLIPSLLGLGGLDQVVDQSSLRTGTNDVYPLLFQSGEIPID